ncbi:trypsin-like serine protease with C-terminal PDZ domain [Aequorivita sublithincola DSM 14238]|uniref:Trypsin-like serine protease with C-terminal PDZ domain n=1 Tax=Aequorivita sublithincola (strain DSM 14238 / LMG 21431 / ACAM 643 / 9-3) TaxID=746697 RepID=I3YSJ4_AEQSU|nr:aspartyl protease family protein [Aequorivita sublithincola]AFL79962.1 trypsin-like serine protease with C-terminal PDZ domain [Aequorivita sublithincola DSM 14238]
MYKSLVLLLLLGFSASLMAQSSFLLQNNRKKDRIPFQLVNNLPIIEVDVNGTPLSFILDTGVKSTILFSLEAADSVQLRNTSPVQLQGLGAGGTVEALKSLNNTIRVGDVFDRDHDLYIIFDSSLNFSPRMGIPIHGILGNEFFQNFIVKINYSSKVITVYDPKKYPLKPCRKCEDLPLNFVGSKPYISLKVVSEERREEVKLLVDSGSSDVIWLFDDFDFIKEAPKNYFKDFLGLGLSGNIFGKRTRIPDVILGNYHLKDVNTSFPEEDAILKARYYQDRDGSVGGGFLSRFTVTFDYGNKLVRFKKNNKFNDPFNYNMSGLTIEHQGMELVKKESQAAVNSNKSNEYDSFIRNSVSITTEVHFSLVPKYVVADVREGSPAALAGIEKDDEILSINGKPCYQYKLYQLVEIFSTDEGKRISMEVKRGEFKNRVKFYLKNVF